MHYSAKVHLILEDYFLSATLDLHPEFFDNVINATLNKTRSLYQVKKNYVRQKSLQQRKHWIKKTSTEYSNSSDEMIIELLKFQN